MNSPRGRDAVVDALLDAATDLFTARGPAAVSVRDIAAAAGVNHGLVHRHFGSKRGLLGAVLDRLAARVAGALARDPDPAAWFVPGGDVDRYWRVLARAILDGEDPARLQQDFPTVRGIVEAMRAGHRLDERAARVEAARAVALGLGWLLFEPFLRPAAGLAAEDAGALRAEVLRPGATRTR